MSYFSISIKIGLLVISLLIIIYYANRASSNMVVDTDPYLVPVTDTTQKNTDMIARLRRELDEVTFEEEYIKNEMS